MTSSMIGLALLLLSLLALTLQRLYSSVPAKELKRLASRGDHLAAALYRPVAYGRSMRLLLWTVFSFSLTGGLVLLANGLVAPAAFVVILVAISAVLFLQSMRLTVHSARIAVHAAPVVSWLLHYIHGPLGHAVRLSDKVRPHDPHSGLYEKDDVIAVLRQQRSQLDNRISHEDLDIMERAMTFDDRQAADILLPISQVKLVSKDEPVGPILLKELHDSGQSSFIVYDQVPERVVGTLFLRDAVAAREGGKVADLVRHKLSYVHEDFTLRQVLQAFMRTNQHVVVVVNSFKEAVGVITLGQLLEQLFDMNADDDEAQAYDDVSSIAAYKPPRVDETTDNRTQESTAGADEVAVEADDEAPGDIEETQPSSPEATEVVK